MIIAERIFDVKGEALSLAICAPVADDRSYRCDYIIAWPSSEQKLAGWGVDPLQALQLTLQHAHLTLLSSTPGRRGEIRYLGSQDLDLPLPEGVKASDFVGREWVEPKREIVSVAPFSVASCTHGGHCHVVRYDTANDRIEIHRLMSDGTTGIYAVTEREALLDADGRLRAGPLGETLLMDTDFGRGVLDSASGPRP